VPCRPHFPRMVPRSAKGEEIESMTGGYRRLDLPNDAELAAENLEQARGFLR
jgi:hypothetical protein